MNVIQKIEHSLTLCEGGAAVDVKLKRIVSTNSMLLRTILALSWRIIPLDLIQGKYPVIKPSV
jgi:hypothetical protein